MRALVRRPGSAVWRLTPLLPHAPASSLQKRHDSILISTTAVNATKTIPPKYKPLYEALGDLKKKASGQVDLSRLQLAIQGLESEQPITRIALLGANSPTTARRLARLLLADASKPSQAWEARLAAQDTPREQALVIRYGDMATDAFEAPRSALPVLLVPSPLLQRRKIELLISSVSTPSPDSIARGVTAVPSDAMLSPTVGTPVAAGGRHSLISQPVHRSLLVASTPDDLLSIAKLLSTTAFASKAERRLVDVVLDCNSGIESSDSQVISVNATKAEGNLQAVRGNVSRTLECDRTWTNSGMTALSKLLVGPSSTDPSHIPLSIRDLIRSLLEAASAALASQKQEAILTARSDALTQASRTSLENAINTFSRLGHSELQSGLAAAWSSRNWRKLAFWKLFWRVDDVPLIINDLVTTAWLPSAERAIYELSGRLKQAGIRVATYREPVIVSQPDAPATSSCLPSSSLPSSSLPSASSAENFSLPLSNPTQPLLALASSTPADNASTPTTSSTRTTNTAILTPTPPLPPPPSITTSISITRQEIINSSTAKLSSAAQQILLRSITITGLSATLSTLSYLSITSGNVYESAAVLALGTAYALRRMQLEWGRQCQDFERHLRDEGRSVLRTTEHTVRALVADAAVVREDQVDLAFRRSAGRAVDRAKRELELLEH